MEKQYKLTLSVNATTAHRAKKYARKRKTSVTKLVENYLQRLVKDEKNDAANEEDFLKSLHPSVREIAGILNSKELKKAQKNLPARLKKKYS